MNTAELRSCLTSWRHVALACLVAAASLFLAGRHLDLPVSLFDGRAAAPTTSQPAAQPYQQQQAEEERRFKLPAAVAEALLHYATSPATPLLTAAEVGLAARAVSRGAPCNFLVFGLGHDSALWAALNHGGRTVFLEEDASWIASVEAKHPTLESYHVAYDTVLADADALLALRDDPACVAEPDLAAAAEASCRLEPRGLFPPAFHEMDWDVIHVDGPTGYAPTRPGRMDAIYAAAMAAGARKPGGTAAATTTRPTCWCTTWTWRTGSRGRSCARLTWRRRSACSAASSCPAAAATASHSALPLRTLATDA